MTTTTTAVLIDVMTPTEQSAYPDDMLLMCPRALSADGARALSVEEEGLEGALRATAAQSEPRTPFDWDDLARPVRWWAKDADYDQEATLSFGALEKAADKAAARLLEAPASPLPDSKKRARSEEEELEEGEYYYCRREATPRPPPSPIADYAAPEAQEEELEEGEYYYCRREATPRPPPSPIADYAAPEEALDEEAAPVAQVRVYFGGQRLWGGAAPPKRARRAAKKAPKPLRVALPMGEGATLARGALTHGMAGGKAEERRRLIEVARELRGAAKEWADAIEEAINMAVLPADAPMLSFGNGPDDDLDLRRSGKGVARHAETLMDALDYLRAPEHAEAAARRGLLVRWPECLPRGVLRCAELHAYLDAWAAGEAYARR